MRKHNCFSIKVQRNTCFRPNYGPCLPLPALSFFTLGFIVPYPHWLLFFEHTKLAHLMAGVGLFALALPLVGVLFPRSLHGYLLHVFHLVDFFPKRVLFSNPLFATLFFVPFIVSFHYFKIYLFT